MKNEELYEKLLMSKGIYTKAKTDIYHCEDGGSFELTFQQKAIWFLQKMNPLNPVYNNPSAVLVKGPLEKEKLRKTFEEIIKRHKILNVGFKEEGGVPIQYIRHETSLEFEFIDYTIDEYKKEHGDLKRYINKIASRPFDLLKDSMLRVSLIKIDENEHVIVINIHHIVSDGWSKGILLKELAAIYAALENETNHNLEPMELQYSDYVRWLKGKADSNEWKDHLLYWKEKLRGVPSLLELPTDYTRPAVQAYKGALLEFAFEKYEYGRIKSFCKEYKITPFVFLLSVLKVLLYRYSGEENLVIGTPVAGRNNSKLEGMIGLFVNTIVIRTCIKGEMKFSQYLETVKSECYEAFNRQELPFGLLVEKLNPKRELSYNPIFQVMFQFDNSPMPELRIGDLVLIPVSVDMGISQVDLSVTCWEDGDILKCTFEYNTELFKIETINRMVSHYKMLINSVLGNPEQIISRINILSDEERKKILVEWNNTASFIDNIPIIKLFERQADIIPDNPAVIFGQSRMSYGELNRKADIVAGRLLQKGVGSETLIAICMDSSVELVEAVLGVLKAGGAFVPIDPQYPMERIATIVKDLGNPVIITKSQYAGLFDNSLGEIILIEDILKSGNNIDSNTLYGRIFVERSDSLVCCIYTSGSTGKPKGVLIENGSVLNLINSFIQSYNVSWNDRLLPITSIASASFVGEILPILSAGGTLVLADMEKILDINELFSYIEDTKVTILSTVPSMIARLNTMERCPDTIRLILSGGETLLPNHINRLKGIQIVNGYGLTESGICNTYKTIETEGINTQSFFSLGRPIINNHIYILDDCLEPVPIGVKGQIFISGIGLARGYLNNIEMTEKRFIPNPFVKGWRMLKTGDIGYWNENGELCFVGRTDKQVQVHGYRVELSEIEKQLSMHKDIREVVVSVRHTEQNEGVLVAYYTTSSGEVLKSDEISEWLAERIPRYMIPRHFVMLESIPLNSNGKVDFNALPDYYDSRPVMGVAYEVPHTATQKAIASVWKECLGIAEVGIHDNFFDIGGHSLLISKVLDKLKNIVEIKLTAVDLFRYPTIASLAKYIDNGSEQISFDSVKERALKQRQAFSRARKMPELNKNLKN